MVHIARNPVALLAVVLAVAGCGRNSGDAGARQTEETIPVKVRTPSRVQRPTYVAASGTVEANETADTGFQIAGRVARVLAEEGQAVRRGQILAELEATDYRFGLQAAEAQAGIAEANLQKARNPARPEELAQAQAAFERAQDEYNRYRQLFERKSMAPADFTKVEAAYKAARAQYEMAQNGARTEDRAAATSAVEQARAQVGIHRKRISDTRLTAPVSGWVARRSIDPGEMVAAGMPVFSIVDLDPAKIRAGIPESDISKVRAGQVATVVIPSLDQREFTGKVELVGVAADPATRTFTAKIVVPNPQGVLRAGMIAEARVQGSGVVDVLTLPGDAIVHDAQGATLVYVYFPDRKRVYGRRIEVGAVRGQDVEVRSGLHGDEQVVIAGQQRVREGAAVEVVR